MAHSKWAAACEEEVNGWEGSRAPTPAGVASGLSFEPTLLDRAVGRHLAACRSSAVVPAGSLADTQGERFTVSASGRSQSERKSTGASADKQDCRLTASTSGRSQTGRTSTGSSADKRDDRLTASTTTGTKSTGDTSDRTATRTTTDSSKRRLVDCVRFRHPEMLRGTRVAGVMRNFGRIFRNSEGSAATYELSSPVRRIDHFLSHNWSTGRLDKFLVLACCFNMRAAIFAALISALLTVPFTVWGILPMAEFAFMESITAHAVGSVVGLLTLACAHEVRSQLGWKGPVTFLDKTCIHQTDADLKREGIESLAAFLEHSDSMIIIYTQTYLKKLWTVYELASMLLLHPERSIKVMPCMVPKAVVCGFFISNVTVTVKRFMWFRPVDEFFTSVTGLKYAATACSSVMCVFVGVCLLKVFADWASDRAEIKKVVQSFSIRNATCFDEADRLVVQDNIVSFMHDLSLVVPNEAEGEEEEAFQRRALDAFDELVREEVPPALAASLGRQSIGYGQAVFMFIGQVLRGLELLAPCILGILPVRAFVLHLVLDLTISMAVMPLVVAGIMATALRHSTAGSKRSTCRRRHLLGEFLLNYLSSYACWALMDVARLRAATDDLWLAIFSLLVLACGLLAAYVYRPVRTEKAGRRVTVSS